MSRELSYLELRNFCEDNMLDFIHTSELEPLESIIGQERAVDAFDFGLRVKMTGYNIYMSGPSGTGKTTYAKLSAEKLAKDEPVPHDWCYVYNFQNPKSPEALSFEPGLGRQFNDDMNELVAVFNTEIPKAFSSEDYEAQKSAITKVYEEKRDDLMREMSDMAKEHGFYVKNTGSGIYFMPLIEGEPINEEQYENLS
ncbi:MAG: AAA family ATPase, partial [Firmicutes bacterium]|nr:AAA family ATPase [Bacillota bacterium]